MDNPIKKRVVRRINARNMTIGFNQMRAYVGELEGRISELEKQVVDLQKPKKVTKKTKE